jgi:hypothetical protein
MRMTHCAQMSDRFSSRELDPLNSGTTRGRYDTMQAYNSRRDGILHRITVTNTLHSVSTLCKYLQHPMEFG